MEGDRFRVLLRQTRFNRLDFSVILALVPSVGPIFRLRRYNGKSHQHTNALETETFYEFHIHEATERYQDLGLREDTYARPTVRYGDFDGAIRCLVTDCAFEFPDEAQTKLFTEDQW